MLREPARPLSQAAFVTLRRLGRRIFGNHFYDVATLRQITTMFPGLVHFAESAEGKPIGFTIGGIAEDGRGWILLMGVLAAKRGSGHGRRLLDLQLDDFRRRRIREVLLSVAPGNAAAVHLYRSAGFTTAARKRDYLGRGRDRLILRYRRPRR